MEVIEYDSNFAPNFIQCRNCKFLMQLNTNNSFSLVTGESSYGECVRTESSWRYCIKPKVITLPFHYITVEDFLHAIKREKYRTWGIYSEAIAASQHIRSIVLIRSGSLLEACLKIDFYDTKK